MSILPSVDTSMTATFSRAARHSRRTAASISSSCRGKYQGRFHWPTFSKTAPWATCQGWIDVRRIGNRHIALEVDEVGRPVAVRTRHQPARLDGEVEVTIRRAHDRHIGQRAVGSETGELFVVAQLPLGLAVQMVGRVEAAGDTEQVALDLVPTSEPDGPQSVIVAIGIDNGLVLSEVDDGGNGDASRPKRVGKRCRGVVVGEDDCAGSWRYAISVQVRPDRAGEHDAGPAIVGKDQGALVGPGCKNNLAGTDLPEAPAIAAALGSQHEVLVIESEGGRSQ